MILSRTLIIFIVSLCFLSSVAYAAPNLTITEIMYDLEGGTDKGREWIEIYNAGTTTLDLAGIKISIVDDDSKHAIVYVSGGEPLNPGGYAIVADNTDMFLSDNPTYQGSLYDSSFSLGNKDGETVHLYQISTDTILDTVTYTSENGAAGDGNSLHIQNGNIVPAAPTPGTSVTSSLSTPTNTSVKKEGSNSQRRIGTLEIATIPKVGYLVGVPIKFSLVQYDTDGEKIQFIPSTINFGDGEEEEVYENFEHIYSVAGLYVVAAKAEYRRKNVTTVSKIEVLNPEIELDYSNKILTISNRHPFDIDISNWDVVSDTETFTFPKNSLLSANSSIALKREFTQSKEFLLKVGESVTSTFPKRNKMLSNSSESITTTKVQNKAQPKIKKETKIILSDKQEDMDSVIAQDEDKTAKITSKPTLKSLFYWLLILFVLIIISLLPLVIKNYLSSKK